MKSANIGKVAFESGLIVFSVLLALFLNEIREQIKEDDAKAHALKMVQVELENNLTTLNKWRPYHETVLENFEKATVASNNPGQSSPYSAIAVLMPEGLIRDLLDDSAWEAIKQSGVSSTLDIDTIFALSKLYKVQSQGVESTLQRIIATLHSRDAIAEGNLDDTLFLMKNGFKELIAQEEYLIANYNKVLEQLKQTQE